MKGASAEASRHKMEKVGGGIRIEVWVDDYTERGRDAHSKKKGRRDKTAC